MGNVSDVCFEENPFQKGRQPSKSERIPLKGFVFHKLSCAFCFLICLESKTAMSTDGKFDSFSGKGLLSGKCERKVCVCQSAAECQSRRDWVIGFACFTYTRRPNYDSDGLYSCLWQDLAATVRFINILMISWAPHSLVSGTNRYSQVTKKISSEWINFSCWLHFGCSQTTIVLLGFILLVPHEFSAVKSTYSSELSYMRSATLEHKDWMQASHVGAVASFV